MSKARKAKDKDGTDEPKAPRVRRERSQRYALVQEMENKERRREVLARRVDALEKATAALAEADEEIRDLKARMLALLGA